ncbi:retron Eco8 family effector endonuclease [Priestia megaterium]|uniref:retron Eco8 family effector endonuclease n=1 Tax=Priestia megaterium TaxID=1404 RepID=UPI001DE2A57E|nr:retron Eco8 family effector endonuclease [Priestia megaterium]CAH0318086.1 DNA replication and repair protein RecF [Priestia megaterium]
MSIVNIEIKNCKSIKQMKIDLKALNCIIGRNGAGKTNLIKAISYFFQSLSTDSTIFDLRDKRNPYSDRSEIIVNFDFSYLIRVGQEYRKRLAIGVLPKNEFFENIYRLGKHAKENQLSIKLIINEKGRKEWFPKLPFDLRLTLKNLYPLYLISTRDLNVTDWSNLWEMIGDLGKLREFEFNDQLEEFFREIYGAAYSDILSTIKQEFKASNIVINKFNISQKFLSILQLQLGGSQFKFNYTELNFFSDGMNSYNYLKIFGILVEKISEEKLKNPLVIYDEPEIGLHPKYIDNLLRKLFHEKNKPQILITTHSPRVLKNFLKSHSNYLLYHIIEKNHYSEANLVKSFYDHREKNIINDLEASLYFSNKIVFVEGNTELELFSNENLIKLFHFLQDVDIYSFNGDSVNIGTAHPSVRNYKVPYLILTDSDQIFEFTSENKIKILRGKKDFLNPLDSIHFSKQHTKERYYFSEKKDLYFLRKRIDGLQNNRYSINKYFNTVYGNYFITHKNLIRSYCIRNNVFPVDTTIEGTLVNNDNVELMKEWLLEKHPYDSQKIEKLFNISDDRNILSTSIRLIFDGKYENLKKIKKSSEFNKFPDDLRKHYLTIENYKKKYSKTSGWVTDWLNFVFKSKIDLEEEYVDKIKAFKKYFPELYEIIYTIQKLK